MRFLYSYDAAFINYIASSDRYDCLEHTTKSVQPKAGPRWAGPMTGSHRPPRPAAGRRSPGGATGKRGCDTDLLGIEMRRHYSPALP